MKVLHHLGYHIIIEWSDKEQRFLVTLPDWKEDMMQPATHGDTFEQALENAKEVLELFHNAANDTDDKE